MLALNDEQKMLVKMLSDLAESEFSERAFTWEGEFPWENVELLADRGYMGINLPEEYGGGGMTEFGAVLAIETVGQVCPDTANALYGQSMVAPRAVDMFGSEAVKERYLPPLCEGESALAIAISEPHAGSDAGAMNTTLTEADNGGYYLNGEKIWVSYVEESVACVVWGRFPDGNLGTVVMDLDADGIDVVEQYENMSGHRQTHFFMEDVYIPEENVLVQGKAALKEQLKALNWERCGCSAYANAIAECAFEQAREYSKEREQFGQSISEFQGIRWKFADMAKRIEASRALTYRAAYNAVEAGRVPGRLDTSIAKLFSAEMVEDVVSESLQTFGAAGYQKEHPLEYLYRLQRSRRIAAGTDEIMKNNIADELYESGLPTLT